MTYTYGSTNLHQQYRCASNDPTLQFRYEIELLKEKLAASQEKNTLYENRIVQFENQIEQNNNQLEFLKQIIKSTQAFEYTVNEYDDEDENEDDEDDEEMDDYEKDEDFIYDGSSDDENSVISDDSSI